MSEYLLSIEDLSVQYEVNKIVYKAVNHLNLSLKEGESLGLVGETGAGKTTTALSIMQLVPDPPGRIVFRADHLPGPGSEPDEGERAAAHAGQ